MGLRISTNIQSMAAQRSLSEVKRNQGESLERLASGNRINKAGDDAAGLAISEKLKSQMRGTQQAARNAGDGISMIQTAEGGLNEVGNILVRLRELSIQSASDTVGEKERAFSNMEFQQLKTELDRIAESTSFNDIALLSGEGERLDFQIGINNSEKNDRISFDPSTSDVRLGSMGMNSLTVASKEGAQDNLAVIDNAINHVSSNRAQLGALQNRLQSTISNLETKNENMAAANSRIRDTDVAHETAELAKQNILTAAGTSVLAQANSANMNALKLIG
jgi:flagellin